MEKMKKKEWLLLLGVLAFHFFLLFKLKFTAWPEMLAWPHFIVSGLLPYRDIAIAHTPLLLLDLSVFNLIFGVGIWQLKAYTWAWILLLDVLVFWVAKSLWGKKVAFLSLSSFVLLQVFFDGNGLWFDLALGGFAVLMFYAAKTKRFLLLGVLWGLAFLIKQTAVWFLLPILLVLFFRKKELSERVRGFCLGALGVGAVFVLLLFSFGIFGDFIRWAVEFGVLTLPKAVGQVQLPTLRALLVSLIPFAVFLPLLLRAKDKSLYLFLWAFAGAMGAYPRFEFFHFQPALPFVAFAAGLVFSSKKGVLVKNFLALLLVVFLVAFGRFVQRSWGERVRFYEAEVREVVSRVESYVPKGKKIYILNYWDSIYAFTGTLPSARPWIPHLPWYMEEPGVQEGLVSSLKKERPEIIVMGKFSESGLSSYKPETIVKFIEENYEVEEGVGNVEILKLK